MNLGVHKKRSRESKAFIHSLEKSQTCIIQQLHVNVRTYPYKLAILSFQRTIKTYNKALFEPREQVKQGDCNDEKQFVVR